MTHQTMCPAHPPRIFAKANEPQASAGRSWYRIEAKAGDGAPTELQWARLMEVERAGGDTMVINESNLDVLDAYLANPSAGCVAIREYDSRRVREHAKKF